jgi:putative ribosome biogenesis GTPase RsgA
MNIRDIKATDIAALTEREYKHLVQIIRQGRDIQTQETKNQFMVGDQVSFMSKGEKLLGTITKILPKNVKLTTDRGNWKVHPSFLTLES